MSAKKLFKVFAISFSFSNTRQEQITIPDCSQAFFTYWEFLHSDTSIITKVYKSSPTSFGTVLYEYLKQQLLKPN